MKNLSTAFLVLILSFSCTDNHDLVKKSIPLPSTTQNDYQFSTVENQIRDYWIITDGRSWNDVDELYKKVIHQNALSANDLDQSALDNFRASAIACMVKVYELLEDTSEEAMIATAYYADEMASIPTCSPEILYPMLEQLKGYLPDNRIAQIARNGYENSESLFEVMKKHKVPQYLNRQVAREKLKMLFSMQ
jgi:hypothetical protein